MSDASLIGPALAARLRAARRDADLTQDEVARDLGIARTSLVALEKGERRVKPDELIGLARLYGRTVDELLRPSAPVEELATQFRLALAKAPAPAELREGVRQLERLAEDYRELERIRHAEPVERFPPPYQVGHVPRQVVAAEIAASERNRLGLGDGPIAALRETLEVAVGLRIFALPLPSKVAGMFAFADDVGACVAVNANHPAERQRWSLAHEYLHFLTSRRRAEITIEDGRNRRSAEEKLANAFALEFLMPQSGVVRHFSEVLRGRDDGATAADVVELAHFYRVAVQSMFLRLEGLRLLPVGTYDALGDEGFKVGEARELLGIKPEPPDERMLPLRYITLAVEAYLEGDVSEGQFARVLRLDRVAARQVAHALGPAKASAFEASPPEDG